MQTTFIRGLRRSRQRRKEGIKSHGWRELASTDFGLTVCRPAGVALRAVGRVGRGDGGYAGAPDEAEGCQAAGGETAGAVAWGTQARLT